MVSKVKYILNLHKLLSNQIEFRLYICTIESKNEVFEKLKNSEIENDISDKLIKIVSESNTSISIGFNESDCEFIFLIFDDEDDAFKLDEQELSGLYLHELMHSIQRRRGLEEDLRKSMNFSFEFFLQLADLVPIDPQQKENLVQFLQNISKMAVLALKDLYANTELIKRGYILQLLAYDEHLLGLCEKKGESEKGPSFDISYKKGKVTATEESLKELEIAINYSLSLMPSWLPFARLNKVENEYIFNRAKNVRNKLFAYYFPQKDEFFWEELLLMEDLYLTSFAFNAKFHRKFFGTIFNIVLQFILGDNFDFYHMSKVSEIISEIFKNDELEKNKILTPLLKAAYWMFLIKREPGIQKENIDSLEALIKKIVSVEEIEEFKEILASNTSDNILVNDSGEEIIEKSLEIVNLFEMTFFYILTNLRKELLDGDDLNLRNYCRALLLLTHLMQCQNPKSEIYTDLRDYIYLILNYKYRIFYRIQQVCKAELYAVINIFEQDEIMSPDGFEELMFNLRFFEVVHVTNAVFQLAVDYSKVIISALIKQGIDNPELYNTIVLVSSAIFAKTADEVQDIKIIEQALPILRATLLALGFNFNTIKNVVNQFSQIVDRYLEDFEVKLQSS